jgi:hypothetical protein
VPSHGEHELHVPFRDARFIDRTVSGAGPAGAAGGPVARQAQSSARNPWKKGVRRCCENFKKDLGGPAPVLTLSAAVREANACGRKFR